MAPELHYSPAHSKQEKNHIDYSEKTGPGPLAGVDLTAIGAEKEQIRKAALALGVSEEEIMEKLKNGEAVKW